MELRIEPRFANLLPPLSANELATLTESIRREGCREALTVWNGVLIDGHNRYDICRKLGVSFLVRKVEFADAEAAEDWIDANQLARRNLKPDDFTMALGRRYNRTKKAAGRPEQCGQNVHIKPERTAEKLAKEHGVNEKTVRRAGKIAEEVESDPELKKAVAAKPGYAILLPLAHHVWKEYSAQLHRLGQLFLGQPECPIRKHAEVKTP